MDAIELYRSLLHSAHDFLEGTLADVTPAQFSWDPSGKAFSIGANYAHVLGAEDMTIQGLLQGKAPLAASAWAGGRRERAAPARARRRRQGGGVYGLAVAAHRQSDGICSS